MVQLIAATALALLSVGVLASAEPVSASSSPHTHSSPSFAPSPDHARENAVHVFNAVHSAMRQWGSSLYHNGLGVIPATVPRGTLLYHGSRSNSTPESFEWLAFEMEHSESFARSWKGGWGRPAPPHVPKNPGDGDDDDGGERPPPPPGRGGPGRGPPGGRPPVVAVTGDGGQRPLTGKDDDDDDHRGPPPRGPGGDEPQAVRGYFHTYRANRDLKLLYLDGMAAGKTDMGTLDTQDFLLRGLEKAPGFGEWERAADVCDLVRAWGLDGVIRMEIGFEAIYCDFSDGLDLVSVLRRPWNDEVEGKGAIDMFEWARAVEQRYESIGGGRVRLDFSGMVNGLWYPLNVTNPNGRKHMPRLGRLKGDERGAILGRVEEVVHRSRETQSKVEWQGIVDMIVTRHADRIEALADEGEDGGDEAFASQVLVVTNTFINYPADKYDSVSARATEEDMVRHAREQCVRHYLTPAAVWRDEWTAEDGLIFEAVETVMRRICGDLYDLRGVVLAALPKLAGGAVSVSAVREAVAAAGDGGDGLGGAVGKAREVVRTLKGDLGWSLWKKCKPGCGVAEVCFIAMWPFGMKEDHYSPQCQNRTSLTTRRNREGGKGYWDLEPGPWM